MNKLGYACINLTLSKDKVSINRGMVKKTFESKGLNYVSNLIILNVKDLIKIINWNEANNIKNYRMSSDMFPWFSNYKIVNLPNYDNIVNLMTEAGILIKKFNHKVSFHPSQFNCLASPNEKVVQNTIFELEQHSILMDLLKLDATPFYNINIHVGGTYGNKIDTMNRFIENFNLLSDNLKKRLTIENDDSKNGFTVQDLYYIHKNINIPIVFDTLHWTCNPGNLDYKDSFYLSYETWNNSIPEIHHSSSKKIWEDNSKTLKTHANFIYEKVETYDKEIYITFESKMKELSIIKYKTDFL